MYDFDSNIILAASIKNRTKKSIIQVYKYFLIDLTRAVIKPIAHRLDNEVFEYIIEKITNNNMNYQIEAPGYH